MTTQSDPSNGNPRYLLYSEENLAKADLDRLHRQQQDPYGRRRAQEAHARDFDMTRMQARNNGEGWVDRG